MLRALGSVLMVGFSLMALAASSAQAEFLLPAGSILLGGVQLAVGKTSTIGGGQIGTRTTKVPSLNIQVICATGTISEGEFDNEKVTMEYEVEKEGKKVIEKKEEILGMGMGKITLSECKVFDLKGVELIPCTKAFNEHNEGGVLKPKGLISVLRHNGKTYLLITPLVAGEAFTVVQFGGTCSLPEKVEIRGSLAVEAPVKDAVKPEITFDTENATAGLPGGKEVQELLGASLLFGAHSAYVQATLGIELTGADKGKAFGAM